MEWHGNGWGAICLSASSRIKREEILYLYQHAETHQNTFHPSSSSSSSQSNRLLFYSESSVRGRKLGSSIPWTPQALQADTRGNRIFRVKQTAMGRYNHIKKKRNLLSFALLLSVLLCLALNQTLGKHRDKAQVIHLICILYKPENK